MWSALEFGLFWMWSALGCDLSLLWSALMCGLSWMGSALGCSWVLLNFIMVHYKKHLVSVSEKLSPDQLRLHEELCKRGSSTWLTSLPLAEHGFNLNKSEFWGALALRYDLSLREFPNHCACGKINSIEHCLSCARGGYVNLRHNQIRDLTANLLAEAGCRDVTIEPHLLPLTGETLL